MSLCGLFIGLASMPLAAKTMSTGKTISVSVVVDPSVTKQVRVYGTGFSVNNNGKGSPGSSTTKTGPAGATYSFGFKIAGKDISCGTAVLNRDSKVTLYYRGGKCVNKVTPK